jgi:hypothetical protein
VSAIASSPKNAIAPSRILAEQAEAMELHYQQNTEWQELEAGDLIEY